MVKIKVILWYLS